MMKIIWGRARGHVRTSSVSLTSTMAGFLDMEACFKKSILRISFDTLVEDLIRGLEKEGFVLCGVADYHDLAPPGFKISFNKYKVLAVISPQHSQAMLSLSSVEGIVVPSNITVAEIYPGRIAVIRVNPTSIMAGILQHSLLQNVSDEVSRKIDQLVYSLGHQSPVTPDLVTSWA